MAEGVIEAALAAHADSGSSSYDSLGNEVFSSADLGGGDDAPVVDDTPAADPVADPAAEGDPASAADPAPAAPEADAIDKLLAAEGVQKESIRGENRIPYSRTKSIIANAQKEWAKENLAPIQQQLEQATGRLTNYENQERIADADPDRFIAMLAAADPRYAKFLGRINDPAPAVKNEPPADNDPEPQPTVDKETGQTYFTPEGFKEHQAWVMRQATRNAEANFEKKYGSVLSRQLTADQQRAAYEARLPIVQKQVARLNEMWGADLVKANEDAIAKVMQEADARKEPISLVEAATQVLMPKLRADESAMRAKILAELNGRKAAAQSAVVSGARTPAGTETLSGEALIKAELDRAFPNRNR